MATSKHIPLPPTKSAFSTSVSAIRAQSERLKNIAQNIAAADIEAQAPGQSPPQRKLTPFMTEMKKGTATVKAGKPVYDETPFPKKYSPGSPGADQDGYVEYANINPLVELADFKLAQEAVSANLKAIENMKSMKMALIKGMEKQ